MILRLAWRSLWRNKRRTLITLSSIGFGLACAIFFISLADGIYRQMVEDAVRLQSGHITLEHVNYRSAPAVDLYLPQTEEWRTTITALESVRETKLIIWGQGIVKSGHDAVGVSIMGVEPLVEKNISPIAKNIVEGRYLDDNDQPQAVLGKTLAERLGIRLGQRLVISTNDIHGTLVGEVARLTGVYDTSSEELDGYLIQIPLGFARRLFDMPPSSATQLAVVLRRNSDQKKTLGQMALLPFDAQTALLPWQKILTELHSYIRMDRTSNVIFQGILIFLILFTIFNTIFMSVLEREKEFATLLALGTDVRFLQKQIWTESLLLAMLGCLGGLGIGCGLSIYLQFQGLDLSLFLKDGITISGVMVSSLVHPALTWPVVIKATSLVFFATVITSLWPARRLKHIHIVDLLR